NLILGIGREDSNVKLSLFDVSNPAQPKEVAKYSLTEYWSDVLNTHHAFMQDEKNQLFFIPGSAGGYIFSYADNTLSLSKTISSISAQRALFINNYLYIIGQDEIVIVDENSLERVNSLIL
nr:beta-propeller domain-containing protein [bacterium]